MLDLQNRRAAVMKYKRRILEVSVDKVQLETRRRRKVGKHLLAATLVYPRPGIAERVTVKPMELRGGSAGFGKASWREKILFKEVVEGPFAVSVEITDAMTDSQAGKVIESLASSALKIAGSEIADVAGGGWGGVLVGLPMKYFLSLLSKKDVPDVLGAGSRDLCADGKWAGGKVKKVKVPLMAEQNVYEIRRSVRAGSPQISRKRILKKGEQSGSVSLRLMLYD